MGLIDGEIAKLWRHEFKKNNIGFDEIVTIGNNLGKLEKPEFIPNVFQLINIAHSEKESVCRTRLGYQHEKVLTPSEADALRINTENARHLALSRMRETLSN